MAFLKLLSPLLFSFFRPSFYKEVARTWRGGALLYLLTLTLIPSAAYTFKAQKYLDGVLRDYLEPAAAQFPTLELEDGRLAVAEPVPYVMRSPKDRSIWVIFDTSGHYDTVRETTAQALVTDRRVEILESSSQIRVFAFQPGIRFHLDRNRVVFWTREAVRWMPFLVFPFFWTCFWMMSAFILLFYALAGQLANRLFRAGLSYGALYRLAVAALTPMVLLESVLLPWTEFEGRLELISYGLPLLYLFFGVWASGPRVVTGAGA